MTLAALHLQQFRHFSDNALSFTPGCNFILGHNGCGKTSVLEAIYFCAYGKSFRSNQAKNLIQKEQDWFQIACRVQNQDESEVLKISYQPPQSSKISIDSQSASVQDAAKRLAIIFMDTSTHRDFSASPKTRRSFLNWCCFYAFPHHASYLQKYNRALLQRNHFLKNAHYGSTDGLSTWNEPLLYYAERIDADRQQVIDLLNQSLHTVWDGLGQPFQADVILRYQSGWRQDQSLAQSLQDSLSSDLQMGYTHCGPHRADLRCRLPNGGSIFEYFSQGQQKLYAYALKFAQQCVLESCHARSAIVVIDDLPAELDASARRRILEYLQTHCKQALLSGLHAEDFHITPKDNVLDLQAQGVPCETISLHAADT